MFVSWSPRNIEVTELLAAYKDQREDLEQLEKEDIPMRVSLSDSSHSPVQKCMSKCLMSIYVHIWTHICPIWIDHSDANSCKRLIFSCVLWEATIKLMSARWQPHLSKSETTRSLANLQGTALQPEYLPIRPRHSDEGRGQHLERSWTEPLGSKGHQLIKVGPGNML